MFTKPVIFAVAVAFAGAASADNVSPGAKMLANLAGVEPGAYSIADLVRLNDTRTDSQQVHEARFIKARGRTEVTRADTWGHNDGTGADQVARNEGVEPGAFSLAELIEIGRARDENDDEALRYYTSGTNRDTTTGDVGRVTPAKAQIAASVGVDPAQYSLAELVELQTTKNFGGNTK